MFHQSRSKHTISKQAIYNAWFIATLFYLYQYLLRVSPGVMVDDLRQTFHLTAEQFSTLGSYYLYTYALLQIPLGILLDKYGVRRIVSVCIALCMLGTLCQCLALTFIWMQLGRILVGIGSAAAFMSSLKIVADYLPIGQRGLLMGATLALGTFGPLIAGYLLVFLSSMLNWELALATTLIPGMLIGIFSLILLPCTKHNTIEKPLFSFYLLWNTSTYLLKKPTIILYALIAIALYTPLAAIADLWGTAFLKEKFSISLQQAAQLNMLMYVGLAIGSIFIPWYCEKYGKLTIGVRYASLSMLILFSFLLFTPPFSLILLALCLISIGIACGAEMLCFTGAAQDMDSTHSGLGLGIVNTMNMLGGALLQQWIGFYLDWHWLGYKNSQGIRQYTTPEYSHALASLLLLVVIGYALTFVLSRLRKKSIHG